MNLSEFISQFNFIITMSQKNLPLVVMMVGVLWLVQLVNAALQYRLNIYGLVPRTAHGLVGIICCPFLHGSFEHLFMNSVALFILLNLMLLYGLHTFVMVTIFIVVASGVLMWCFGRRAIHVGASGLVMGYWAYVLLTAYQQGTVIAILIAVLCLYYLRGLIVNLMPGGEKVSWEGHVFGFLAGVAAVFL